MAFLAANANAKRDLYIAIDNRAVVDQLKEILQGNRDMCPRSAFGRWRRIRQKVAGQHVETMWIPSHSKRAQWLPPEEWPLDAKEWRTLNDLADKAAGEGAERCKRSEVDATEVQAADDAKDFARCALERQVANFVAYAEQDDSILNRWRMHLTECQF